MTRGHRTAVMARSPSGRMRPQRADSPNLSFRSMVRELGGFDGYSAPVRFKNTPR